MSTHPATRAEPLAFDPGGRSSPLWLGVALLLTIDVVAFGTLISSYLYLRFHAPEWPPTGAPLPELRLAFFGTVLLVSSTLLAWSGSRAVARGSRTVAAVALIAGSILALAFVGVITAEVIRAPVRWDRDAYGSLFWVTLLLYAVHALALVVAGLMMSVLVRTGELRHREPLIVDVVALFWHGTVALWFPVFLVIYLVPRWV
jgi:cytochrome c oxidase subunit III